MDIRKQIERLDQLIEFVENELPRFAENVLAVDVIAQVFDRVTSTGESHTGALFTAYSTQDIPAFRFWGKSRTQTAEDKVRALARDKNKRKRVLNYQKFRDINGLNSDKKTFEFTGDMWSSLGVIETVKTATGFTTRIASKTKSGQEKIEVNSEREGLSIIEANEVERALAQQGAKEWLEDNANRILNE